MEAKNETTDKRPENKVGWFCTYIPEEVIHAAGFMPYRLIPRHTDGNNTVEDDLPGNICPYPRKILNNLRSGLYEKMAGLVVANSYNAMIHLYNILKDESKPLYLLDVPFRESDGALAYVASQLAEMAGDLERQTGKKLTDEKIREVFDHSNRARYYQLEVARLRQGIPSPLTGEEALSYVYLTFLGQGHPKTPEIYRTLAGEIQDIIDDRRGDAGDYKAEDYRLIWLHLRPYHPSEMISCLEKDLRHKIVAEEMNYVYWPPLDPDEPFLSLARKAMSHPGLGPIERRLETIEKMVEDYGAHGVIHFFHWGCRQSVGGTLPMKKKLRQKGIPFLALDGDCIDGSSFPWSQTLTRIEGFHEVLEQLHV